jgi:hypothetical protein
VTENKALKRDVRRRMAKTGERYTAARRNVVKPPRPRVANPGMSDEAILRGTGKTWDEWLAILDAWGADRRSHPEIARHLSQELGVGGWWAQSVTVGYERARGMRGVNERPDGFSATVSKTFPVPVERLHRMVVDARQRRRWLEPETLRVRTSKPPRSARFDWGDGEPRVNAWFLDKGAAKSSVHLQIERLADADAVAQARTFWKERLVRLGAALRTP